MSKVQTERQFWRPRIAIAHVAGWRDLRQCQPRTETTTQPVSREEAQRALFGATLPAAQPPASRRPVRTSSAVATAVATATVKTPSSDSSTVCLVSSPPSVGLESSPAAAKGSQAALAIVVAREPKSSAQKNEKTRQPVSIRQTRNPYRRLIKVGRVGAVGAVGDPT